MDKLNLNNDSIEQLVFVALLLNRLGGSVTFTPQEIIKIKSKIVAASFSPNQDGSYLLKMDYVKENDHA